MKIGGVLRKARINAGFSQARVARKSGVSQAQVSRIENDMENASLPTLRKIAKAVGMKPSDAFGLSGE